jgi:hypothetical protein
MHRNIRALAAGTAAAAAYLAGSRLRQQLPVRPAAWAVLAVLGTATVMRSTASAKAYEVEARLNDILANGCTFQAQVNHNARLDINSGNLHMHGNNINLEGGSVIP